MPLRLSKMQDFILVAAIKISFAGAEVLEDFTRQITPSATVKRRCTFEQWITNPRMSGESDPRPPRIACTRANCRPANSGELRANFMRHAEFVRGRVLHRVIISVLEGCGPRIQRGRAQFQTSGGKLEKKSWQ